MPLVQIEVVKGRSAAEKKALFDAVHTALVATLKIPDDDRTQTLLEHDLFREARAQLVDVRNT